MLHVQGKKQRQQREACKESQIREPGRRDSWQQRNWLPISLDDRLTCAPHEHPLSTLEQVTIPQAMLAVHHSKNGFAR